jgi:hypothetical protein
MPDKGAVLWTTVRMTLAQIYWNHVMELMTGYAAKEALGRPMVEVFGFFKNDYVRRSHFLFIKNTPKVKGCVQAKWTRSRPSA